MRIARSAMPGNERSVTWRLPSKTRCSYTCSVQELLFATEFVLWANYLGEFLLKSLVLCLTGDAPRNKPCHCYMLQLCSSISVWSYKAVRRLVSSRWVCLSTGSKKGYSSPRLGFYLIQDGIGSMLLNQPRNKFQILSRKHFARWVVRPVHKTQDLFIHNLSEEIKR